MLLLSLFVGCGLLIGLCLFPEGESAAYVVAQQGALNDSIDVTGLFLYEEVVVSAEEAGTFYPALCSGDGVAADDICGEFHRLNDLFAAPVVTVASPVSGIYSEAIDGWEGILVPERLGDLELPAVLEGYEPPEADGKSFFRRGEPCFKVIDNKKDIVFLAELGTVTLTEERVSLAFGEEACFGTVLEQKHFARGNFALISMAPFDGCYGARRAEATLILGRKEGILVSEAALTTRFGEIGVYRVDDGGTAFCPVTVVCRADGQCLVSGISSGDRLLCGKSDCVF